MRRRTASALPIRDVLGWRALAALLLLVAPPGAARAGGTDVSARPPPRAELLSADPLSRGEIARIWQEGLGLESRGEFLESAYRYERVARAVPERSDACWRAARSYWRVADAVPTDRADTRLRYFERAQGWAAEGLETDPECGECALWQYASIGRQVPHRGWVWAARRAREMSWLLDRGIELQPTHRDPDGNTALGNLYYASAVFHRMVPEWWWLPMVFGAKGDTDRALRDIRKALEISHERIDYSVEHGAILLCSSLRHERPEELEQGRAVLRASLELPQRFPTDPVDLGYARQLLVAPDKACGFSRLGFMDVEAEGRKLGRSGGR